MQESFPPERGLADAALLAFVPEQRAANERILARPPPILPANALDAISLRRARTLDRSGRFRFPRVAEAYDGVVATTFGDVSIRIFPASDPCGLVVHLHGGGWAFGSIHEQDDQLAGVAAATGATVVSVEYPLAPEHRLPHALDVASHALEALITRQTDVPVALLGESAGAHVALQSLLRLPSDYRGRVQAICLTYGIYDLSMTPSQRNWGSQFLGLSTDWLNWFYALTLPGLARTERSDPKYSPLFADLAGLPPALISVGERDPLLDDSLFLFQRWRAAGGAARLRVYPEAPHGFNHHPTAMARRCDADVAAFLQAAFVAARGSLADGRGGAVSPV
jgi:acetyl esterase/lipase